MSNIDSFSNSVISLSSYKIRNLVTVALLLFFHKKCTSYNMFNVLSMIFLKKLWKFLITLHLNQSKDWIA